MLGVGIEYAITDNWTIKAEYDAVRLSSRNFIVPVGSPFFVGDTFNNGGRNVQEFKVGLQLPVQHRRLRCWAQILIVNP